MEEPIERNGVWWRRSDHGWLRWDPVASAWVLSGPGPEGEPQERARRLPDFTPLEGHMRWAVGFLAAAVVFDMVAVLSGFQQYLLLGRLAQGAASLREIAQNDARQAAVGALQLGLLVVAAIAFLRWFRRAYANLPGVGRDPQHGTGWAIGAWFVPILNLFRPKQIADELWRAGDEDRVANVPLYVHMWWTTFLVGGFIGNVAGRVLFAADDVETLRSAAGWVVVSDVLSVVAGILLIRFVQESTARLTAARARLTASPASVAGSPPSPPPPAP